MALPAFSCRTVKAPSGATRAVLAAATLGVTLLAGAGPAAAGRISPGLQDQLSRVALNEPVTAIFNLNQQVDMAILDASLKARHATRQERHFEVVSALQQLARETQGPLVAELETRQQRGEVTGFTPYWISNLIVVRATRSTIEEMANRADIDLAEVNFQPTLIQPLNPHPADEDGGPRAIGITPGVKAINANKVWYQLGVWGEGAIVANLDTGVDGNHPALSARWRGAGGAHPWQECWKDVLGTNTQFPTDTGSHGTHVMGSITGLAPNDSIGVSPRSQWIAANAINQGVGNEFDNDVVACFQWLADPDGNVNTVTDVPDVVQNSWGINEGFGGSYVDCDSRWNAAIDNCEAASVVVTWSAGNEGPGATSLRSPADRATTLYNVFSVGAVDCTNDQTFPYNIASFSSRGPTGCNVPAERKIKPEICAPGVDVYSSFPGGSYGYLSGTSMAGPHVAGVVGLMRSINPDIDVDTVKEILMATARDQGTTGEDNTYGWGVIDAFEAVIQSTTGYGTLAGQVRNASNGNTGIPLAQVRLVEINRTFVADGNGNYSGAAAAASYTAEATHPSFATQSLAVTLTAGQVTTQNFSLTDIGAPIITEHKNPDVLSSEVDPIPISCKIVDFSALSSADLFYRVNNGAWNSTPMGPLGLDKWQGFVPGQPFGTDIDYYFRASDVASNTAFDPPNAPLGFYSFTVTLGFFSDDIEADEGWVLSQAGDASNGRWVRVDPIGTTYSGQQMQPEDDHTSSPGVLCFVTGQGVAGDNANNADVDFGCVTLTSPVIDLSNAIEASVGYWRWFGQAGPVTGDKLETLVSSNGGTSWISLQTVSTIANSWTQVSHDLTGVITFTNNVRFRYVACDLGSSSLVEGAIDDVVVTGLITPPASVGDEVLSGNWLYVNLPNPARPETLLRFRLAATGEASLAVYDAGGRRIRNLVSGSRTAGEHSVLWDGKDDLGHALPSGIYLYRFTTGSFVAERKMLLMH